MPLSPDTLLQGGKYRIVRFIAGGGFGSTYEALHVMLNTRVAIKEFFMSDYCNRDAYTNQISVATQSMTDTVNRCRRKFLEEARALYALRHRGIVRVSDVFEENGTSYFVMDYLEGCTLNEITKRGPLDETTALHYFRQLCEALDYVHRNNRLHLDIKPGNVMVDHNGHTTLIDFGASKQYDPDHGKNNTTLLSYTPGYAPPEQIGGNLTHFSPSTDIYALGAVLYRMLTGVTPPPANERSSGLEMDPLPPSISSRTRRAVEWTMQLRKQMRPQSISELLALLDKAGSSRGGGASLLSRLHTALSRNSKSPEDGAEPALPIHEAAEDGTSDTAGESNKASKAMGWKLIAGIALTASLLTFILALTLGGGAGQTEEAEAEASAQQSEEAPQRVENKEFTDSDGDTYLYTGTLNANGLPEDDHGVAIFETGTYEGAFRNGLREGAGTFTTADKSNHFVGTFENDHYKEGVLHFPKQDNIRFEGTFMNDRPYDGPLKDKDGVVLGYYEKGHSPWE